LKREVGNNALGTCDPEEGKKKEVAKQLHECGQLNFEAEEKERSRHVSREFAGEGRARSVGEEGGMRKGRRRIGPRRKLLEGVRPSKFETRDQCSVRRGEHCTVSQRTRGTQEEGEQ